MAASFLLGRADAASPLVPFSLPFVATVADRWPGRGYAAAVAAVAGAWVGGGAWPAAQAGATILAYGLLRRVVPAPARVWVGLCSGAAQLVVAGSPPDPWAFGFAAVRGLLGGLLAAAFARALAGNAEGPGPEGPICRSLLAGCSLAGLGHLTGHGFDPWAAGAAAAVLLAARDGPAAASGAGLAIGGVGLATGTAGSAALAVYGLGGLLAGFFAAGGPLGAVAGLSLGFGLVGLSTGGPMPDLSAAVGAGAGAVAFLLVPEGWRRRLWPADKPVRAPEESGAAAAHLAQLAEAVGETARAFRQVGSVAEATPLPEPGEPADELVRTVCHGCRSFACCWQRDYIRAYKMLGDLLALAEVRQVKPSDVGGEDTVRCLRPGEMARAINWKVRIAARERRWAARLDESRAVMAGQLEGLSRLLADVASELAAAAPPAAAGAAPLRRPLRYETGIASVPRPGRLTSGDTHLVRELPGDLLLLALSDGMGSGSRAAAESSMAMRLLERLLEARFGAELAVRTVNSVLVLRPPDDSFATLDLALVRLAAGEAEFIKVGAAPGLVRHGAEIRVVHAPSLPAGVLPEMEVQVVRLPVGAGDEVVLVTDGVLDSQRRGDGWLRELLAAGGTQTAEERARAVLERALREVGTAEHDDMTVLVCRLLPG